MRGRYSTIRHQLEEKTKWKEQWEFFWVSYNKMSSRPYVDKRGKNKHKEELLSPKERYWNAFKETLSDRKFTSNKMECDKVFLKTSNIKL